MRAGEFIATLIVGIVLGAAGVLMLIPEAHLSDLIGGNVFVLDLAHSLRGISHFAATLVAIFVWVLFIVVFFRIWRLVFRGVRRSFRDPHPDHREAHF